jgi:GT2 family glycosyltransferase
MLLVVWDGTAETIPQNFKHRAVLGVQPFIFARNANIGIACAGRDDVVLLNDDALLGDHFGLDALEVAAKDHPEYGVIAASTNSSGNPLMLRRRELCLVRESPYRALAFVCVYIPRSTLDLVGPLDERFTAYGWEDTDYCRRVKQAGLKLGISDMCFVDHLSLPSAFRGPNGAAGDIEPGRRIYIDKWGDDGL